jgi:hypothetical protein
MSWGVSVALFKKLEARGGTDGASSSVTGSCEIIEETICGYIMCADDRNAIKKKRVGR